MADEDQNIPSPTGSGEPAGGRGTDQPDEAVGDSTARDERTLARKLLRYLLIAVGSVVAGIVLLMFLFVLALQTNWGGTNFADFLFAIANPFSESETEFAELNGNFITSLEFRDLRAYRLDTVYVDTVETMPLSIRHVPKDSLITLQDLADFDTMYVDTLLLSSIDTLRMRYNLLSLLRRRVHFRELTFANPVFRARQRADSTWDLMEPFGADTSQADPGQAAFTFEIESFNVTDGELFAMRYPPDADSLFRVEDFNIRARDVRFEDLVSARVDTLYGSYTPPGQDYWTHVRTSGIVDQNDLDLAGLRLESPFSFVTASGRMTFPSEEDEDIENIDFVLDADPIAFQDLQIFVPSLVAGRSATASIQLGGSSRLMDVDASGSLSDGGSFNLTGALSPLTDGPVEYRAEGSLAAFDPSFFTGAGDASTLLNADFAVDLVGTDTQTLDGTASADLVASRVSGLSLDAAGFTAEFDGGEADVSLTSSWNGGTISAEGSVRPFDEIPSYRLQGRSRNFNLAAVGDGEQQTNINSTFTLAGHGLNPRTAEAEGDVRLSGSSVNEYTINDGRFQFELAGGEMSYGFRFLFPDGLLVANGTARFEDPFRFAIQRGRFENVDLAALLGQEGPSSLNGTFSASGVGSDLQQMEAEAVLDMTPSAYGTYQLQDGTFRMNLSDGVLNMTAVADMQEAGQFDFAAVTRPFDEVPTFRVTRGRFTNVDVGTLFGMPGQDSDLSGTAAFTIRGFDPQTMQLEGRFDLADSRLNEQQIDAVAANVRLNRGVMTFDADVDIPEGSASLTGTARPFRDVPTYEVSEGRFRNINLASLTGDPGLESSLNGTLSISGTGFDPETMTIQGRVDVSASRINEQQIDAASITGTLEGGTFDVELDLSVPEGDTRLVGTIRPFLETPIYTVREGTFAGINIAALTGDPDWQTNLAGEISLEGTGFDPETLSLHASVVFDSSRVNDTILRRGTVTASISRGFTDFDANLAFAEGSADVRGSGRIFDDVPSYALAGTVSNVDVADIVGNDTLQAQFSAVFDVEGTGTDPETMELRGLVRSGDGVYEGADIDSLYTQFFLTDGVLQVDSLFLRSSAADASGSGVIAVYDTTTASDFRFVADVRDLSPFRSLVAAERFQLEEGYIEGRIYGRPGTLRFDASGTVSTFIYDDIRLSEFEGTVAGEIGRDRQISLAEVRGEFTSIALPQLLIQNADLNITYTPEGIRFDGTIVIDQGRVGEIAGRVETAPDARRVVLETMTLDLDGQEWELLQEASISYGDEYRVRNFLLFSDDQQLAIDGVIDPDGEQNLIMTVESFEVGPFAELLGFEGLDALVDGTLTMTGPADAPDMSGTLNADISSFAEDVGDMRLALNYDNLRLNVDALVTHDDGSTLSAVGFVPLDLRVARLSEGGVSGGITDRAVNFTIVADSFGVGWIEPFLDPTSVSEFSGRLTANVGVSGALEQPVLDGTARYSRGRIGLPEIGVTYQDIEATFALSENDVDVRNFIIRSGSGSVRGDGTINLTELTLGEFDLDLIADEFLAIDSREYRFVVDGDMSLSGTTRLPVLRGDVDVVSGEILLTEETTSPELEQVQLNDQELQTVERRFGIHITAEDTTTFSLYDALAMELDLRIERNTWIRSQVNPVMDVQFSGGLDLIKDHYEDVSIFGTIEVVPQRSRIVQFGKRFEITTGTLTFNGPAADPLIDIAAEHDVRTFGFSGADPDVTITLSLEGRMSEQLDLELGSDPNLDNADIVSYLATGRPASAGLQLGGAGAGLALDQLTTIIEGIAEAGLGLDVVTVEYQAGTPVLTAGSYVSPRLFISIRQPVGEIGESGGTAPPGQSRPVITAEYEVTNWLLLQLLQHGQTLRLNLQWEYSY